MMPWALTFLVVTIVTGLLGFGGVVGIAAWIARILFLIFLGLFIASLVSTVVSNRKASY
jgi:uncharacterized membrane protein YtjA (UPF0391 family)